jgi:hypothetical protein
MLTRYLLIGLSLCWSLPILAEDLEPAEAVEQEVEERKTGDEFAYRLEFSFGSSLLFVEQPLLNLEKRTIEEERVMPISSVLILGEYLFTPRWSLGTMLNVPTSTKRRVVDGSVIEEHSAVSVGAGITYKPIVKSVFDDRASFRLQMGLLGAYGINSTDYRFFPVAVLRPSLATPKGTSMYLGTAYSFQTETLALIYGVSQLF